MRDAFPLVLSLSAVVMTGCGAAGVATNRLPPVTPIPARLAQGAKSSPPITGSGPAASDVRFAELSDGYAGHSVVERQRGLASYYAGALAGHPMANGQAYDPQSPCMAHRTLALGAIVRVVRVSTGADVVVRVTDRGPYGNERRIADLSFEAARRLGMLRDGVVEVRLEVLSLPLAGTHKARRRH
jgi:rare lipoprotein A